TFWKGFDDFRPDIMYPNKVGVPSEAGTVLVYKNPRVCTWYSTIVRMLAWPKKMPPPPKTLLNASRIRTGSEQFAADLNFGFPLPESSVNIPSSRFNVQGSVTVPFTVYL